MSKLVQDFCRALGIGLFILNVFLYINISASAQISLQQNLLKNDKNVQLNISAESAILMEKNTGVILYEKEKDSIKYPASLTKVMTALIVLEHTDLDEMVTFSHDALFSIESGSSILGGIEEGDKMSVRDCLYGLLLTSGNEIAYALAEHVGGDVASFVDMMNERASELGCYNTSFSNPHGLHDENHHTSAFDMALIFQEALKNPTFCEIISTRRYQFPDTRSGETRIRLNHHKMLEEQEYAYQGCLGGKTGYTTEAGSTLVTFAERNGMQLICVVLGDNTPEHYTDTQELFDYGFENYEVQIIGSMNELTCVDDFWPNIDKNISQIICLNPDSYLIKPKDITDADISKEVSVNENDSTIEINYFFDEMKLGTGVYCIQSNDDRIDYGDELFQNESHIVINVKVLFLAIVVVAIMVVLLKTCINNAAVRRKRKRHLRRKRCFPH